MLSTNTSALDFEGGPWRSRLRLRRGLRPRNSRLNVVRRGGAETEEKSTLRLVGEAALITAGLGTALYVITKPLRDYGPIF